MWYLKPSDYDLAGALTVGLVAGSVSTLGFAFLTPLLERTIGLGDTCVTLMPPPARDQPYTLCLLTFMNVVAHLSLTMHQYANKDALLASNAGLSASEGSLLQRPVQFDRCNQQVFSN